MIDRYSIYSSSSDDGRIIEAKDTTNTDDGGKQKQQQQQRHHHSSYSITPNDIRPYDVLCGRDKAVFNSIGNRRFRVSISVNVPGYERARNKAQKTTVILYVCSIGEGGGALKKGSSLSESEEEYHYIELEEAEARKKVGHALRDMSVARKQLNEERKSFVRIHTKKGTTPARKSRKRQRDNYDDVKQSRQRRVSDDTFGDDDGNDDDDEEKDEG
ncbi:hypothetical protein FRACYDRAFT_188247 [Fragilariopsis cylindrus CCMP1102]|uniref:DUF6824 domain-containing protein n=1 Tax=Fragilariopsis cylindrus CCMP1102 TaxID=635003 RepID=A0A1E7F9R3_9STRA|nr:hypothetical protein FRACYDRAFT_188247 [Fragilariopsis cylindrus CCMP1102]|eukprot:OEU14912.1 hypothetical protein FRACYDRAFT_188247 [Fragilariopsis cylindrus CCMP1102]